MIRAIILGDDALAARLAALPGELEDGVDRRLARFAIGLRTSVTDDWLAGRVLARRSGALADSVEIRAVADGDGPRLSLVATAPYAAFQEFGFSGVESVAAYLRTIREAFGRPIRAGAREVTVRAHARQIEYPAHSFLRAALDDMAPALRDELAAGADDVLAEFSS